MKNLTPRQLVLTIARCSDVQQACLAGVEHCLAHRDQDGAEEIQADYQRLEQRLTFYREELRRAREV